MMRSHGRKGRGVMVAKQSEQIVTLRQIFVHSRFG